MYLFALLTLLDDCAFHLELGSGLVSQLSTTSVCFSDHYLLTCRLGVPPTPPVMVTYTYRQIRRIDTEAFCRDMLCSRLYDSTTTDADEYAELFDSETRRVLDSHAPLLTRSSTSSWPA